jgi:hypothetical protein
MLISFIALFAAISGDVASPNTKAEITASRLAAAAALEGRENARIPFTSNLRHFQVKYENHEDVLYLSTGPGKWYRAPLTCYGMGDAQSAMQIVPIDRGDGIDKFTRFRLITMGDRMSRGGGTDCTISSLIELTTTETVIFGVESQRQVDARAARAAARARTQTPNR